jgi:hypothetical protein
VIGEWFIPSAEGKSYPFMGKPKQVAAQLVALKVELMNRVWELERAN